MPKPKALPEVIFKAFCAAGCGKPVAERGFPFGTPRPDFIDAEFYCMVPKCIDARHKKVRKA